MKINKLIANNLKEVSCDIINDDSYGVAGLSGSGKSTFCLAIANESVKRVVTLLPKSEYRFLFSDSIVSNFSAQKIENMPLVFYLGKSSFSKNPRSTVGTHTGVYTEVRQFYADFFNKTTEFFSFNNSINWCTNCKGRGSNADHECKSCLGNRYDKSINDYKVDILEKSYSIIDINKMSIIELFEIADYLNITESKKNLLNNMMQLNVGYLSNDRIMSTLSGGETVRVLLSEFIAACKDSLIIIDEISIGLDHNTLVKVIERISELGVNNQIWLIDHSDFVLNSTGQKIFFGPSSGKDGGNIVEYSPRPLAKYYEINNNEIEKFYNLDKMEKRNIKLSFLDIPKNRITSITGESGCGKSTLINDCIIPMFKNKFKNISCELIGQDKNQSITSRSTLATFLDLKKRLQKYDDDIFIKELSDIKNVVNKDKYIYPKIKMLIDLGLGYLTFNRSVQTLSTGEFQCLHLVSKISKNSNKEVLLIFDEPSKGLSQNILNLFMKMIRNILLDSKKTILIIEHNEYILKSSDYIIDFEKRKEAVENLQIEKNSEWIDKYTINQKIFDLPLHSKINDEKFGIEYISTDIDNIYKKYENVFKGGILKKFSQTAQWIYKDYTSDSIIPVIVLDLESNLYSKNTFLFEVAGIINSIVNITATKNVSDFDFYSTDNLCECCKGKGNIDVFNFETIIKDARYGLWDNLLYDDIMISLKKYNLTKIKFLFKEIKKETGYDLSKPYNKMTDDEKKILLYGYWKTSFYDKSKKTKRKWKGLIRLIFKYIRSSKSEYKKIINNSKINIKCPICNGAILKHDKPLTICDKDIRKIMVESINDNFNVLSKIKKMNDIVNIVGKNTELNKDVSTLPIDIQVSLKLLELQFASLFGYEIILKNVAPFKKEIQRYIDKISKNNKVLILDYDNIKQTKDEMLSLKYGNKKIKNNTYVYELFGYKKIMTEINNKKKSYKCEICNGSKVLREKSIFEGVDITETPCHDCLETGISEKGLKLKVENIPVRDWLTGSLKILGVNIPKKLENISPTSKVYDLNKKQLNDLRIYLEG